jgi:hypothetical protein
MTKKCDGCGGFACADCADHVHPWDGWHFCEPGRRRENAERLAAFVDALRTATAVISPQGLVHDVECPTVRAHITWASTLTEWRAWPTTRDRAVVGKSCKSCSPAATVQAKPRQRLVRLTGLGWPDDEGGCVRGHVPRWAKHSHPSRLAARRAKAVAEHQARLATGEAT